jgi:hypothetical protein
MTRRVLGTFLALAFGLLGLAVVPGALPAAQAVTGSPPVTTPDAVTVLQGNGANVQPINNDHDADNDVLAICRLGPEHYKGLTADFFGYDWEVFAKPSAKPGTYTFTYYACDFSYLTAGTITVTVEKLPQIKVVKVASRPGRLRVTNPADMKVRFLYGSFKEDRPDGTLLLSRNSSAVISVHRTRIDWVATNRRGDLFLGSGHVDGITLARAVGRALAHAPLSSRLAQAWRTA